MDRRVGSNAELIQQGKNELFIRVVVKDSGRKRRELIAQRNTELADLEPLAGAAPNPLHWRPYPIFRL